jgi:tetratricopeptide (TPR) repeat protein
MRTARLLGLAAAVVAALAAAPGARAAGSGPANKDAKRAYEEATAAFGLGRYAEAAEKYEAAFALKPDPALLYNAAQSYRLAGNKSRALELYRNYVRLYPDGTNAEDARSHVAALKKAIEDERPPIEMARPPGVGGPAPRPGPPAPAASVPPAPPPAVPAAPLPPAALAMPPPVETRVPVAPPAAAPPPVAERNVPLVSQPAAPAEERQGITHQTWFWVAAGAAVLVAGGVVILLATRGETFPDASFGTARGN